MQVPQDEEKAGLPQALLGFGDALAYACKNKVKGMDLGNHRSAYNCLRKLDGKYKESLQRMGYGRGDTQSNVSDSLASITSLERPHNFWIERFDPNNGARGLVPIYPSEWALVGLDSDVKCFNLMKFLYGFLGV